VGFAVGTTGASVGLGDGIMEGLADGSEVVGTFDGLGVGITDG